MPASPRCVLGIDLGTSSLKCLILDETGAIRASASAPYPTANPHPGWAEQNPDDWFAALRDALAALRRTDAEGMAALCCVGICSAAHMPVLLDARGRVIRPAILWSDQRSDVEAAALRREHGALLERTTLNQPSCTWTLPQLMWLRRHEPEAFACAHGLLSSKDYLIFRLCARRVMDVGSAAATLMLDCRHREWNAELVALGGLPAAAMPTVHGALDVIGRVTAAAAAELGLPAGTPVIAGALDSAAELVGCGILAPEDGGMIRVGSSGGVMATDARPSCCGGIITYPFVSDGLFYRQAGTNACATSLQWVQGLFGFLGDDARQRITYGFLDELAASTPPGAGGLVFHPYLQGERAPYWNPRLRASFTGIEQSHGWPHFVRAVMEGVAFSLKDCLTLFVREGFGIERAAMAGGIAKSPVWSQIIADVLAIELHTIRHGDSAFGTAMMAAVSGGLFADLWSAAAACVRHERAIVPDATKAATYARMFAGYAETAGFLNCRTDARPPTCGAEAPAPLA